MNTIVYEGFNVNGRECEIFLGDAFETHLPSRNRIVVNTPVGEQDAAAGDILVKDVTGCWIREP